MEARHFPLVIVTWVDAATDSGWTDTDEAHDFAPPECMTVGYLVSDKPDHLVLAQTHGGNEMGNRWVIPRGMVTKIRQMGVGDDYVAGKGEDGHKKKTRRRTSKSS